MSIEPNNPVQPCETSKGQRALLDVSNLYVEYLTPRGPARAVNDVSFCITEGQVFGLAGESGCGKSTIAHAILRTLKPPAVITGGQILFKGQDVLEMDSEALQSFRWRAVSMAWACWFCP